MHSKHDSRSSRRASEHALSKRADHRYSWRAGLGMLEGGVLTPRSLVAVFALVLCLPGSAAEEIPGWNVRDAAEKLLDKHALRLPAADWFLKKRDGNLVHYDKPTLSFKKAGGNWEAEVLTVRWRERKDGKWGAWVDARPKYSNWRMARIAISAPSTGGAVASFKEAKESLEGFTPPNESTVNQVR